MDNVYIIIPVFKRLDHTLNFINSCKEKITGEKLNFLVVDDEYPEFSHLNFFKERNDVIVLKGTGNLWWGGSINLGLKYLKDHKVDDYSIVVWANNDSIIDSKTFQTQKKYLLENPNSFFHPRVLNNESKQEVKDCGNLKSWIPLRCAYIFNQVEEIKECNLVSGRFLMSYWVNFKKVGNISKNLPHYGGDWDYSLRAEKLGLKTFLVRNAISYVDFSPTGIKYEHRIGFLKFIDGLFYNIKSPQNLKYKFYFYRNHHSLIFSIFATITEFLKTITKFTLYRMI